MNPPQVYMYSPSWTLLPPPSPYHPSGSSQCTSPKHPVSCIEPGLRVFNLFEITSTYFFISFFATLGLILLTGPEILLSFLFLFFPHSCHFRLPGSSVGKESICYAGDPGSIPGSGRSSWEGICYPLQYYWASLVAQLVKNPLAVRETWVRSLGWEDPLEKGKATHSSSLGWRIPWTV